MENILQMLFNILRQMKETVKYWSRRITMADLEKLFLELDLSDLEDYEIYRQLKYHKNLVIF